MWHSPYQLMSLPDFWSPLTFAFCAFWIQRSQVLRPQLLVLGFGGLARLWERWVVRGARGSVHRWFGESSTFFSPQPPKKPAPSSPQKKISSQMFPFFGGVEKKTSSNSRTPPTPLPIFLKARKVTTQKTTIVPSSFFGACFGPAYGDRDGIFKKCFESRRLMWDWSKYTFKSLYWEELPIFLVKTCLFFGMNERASNKSICTRV